MSRKLTFGVIVIVIFGLLVSACGAQIDVTGQVNEETGSGSLDINIGGGSDGSNSGTSNSPEDGSQTSNQAPVLSTQGLLILVGLGMMLVIGLLLGLMRSRSQQ